MKNLMIFIHPQKGFFDHWGDEAETLVKIQIDNSISMGWKKSDIVLVTNFDYEYRGVKSIVISDKSYCKFSPTVSKIKAVIEMFDRKLIDDEVYWFHDLDAFQINVIDEKYIKDEFFFSDFCLTDYGITTINSRRNLRPSTGVIFFNNKSKDIFDLIYLKCHQYECNEEVALLELLKQNKKNINYRISKINISYNYATRRRNLEETYKIAEKPLRIIHFHPFDKRPVAQGVDNISACMYGKNNMNKVLMSDNLIKIFNRYGIN